MAISTIGTDALASAAVTSAKLASGAPSRSQLPAGTVLQVVNATYSNATSSASTSFADSGLSASITPSSASSKILVLVQVNGMYNSTQTTSTTLQLVRNSTSILQFEGIAGYTPASALEKGVGGSSASYLDSPATTSATTYKLQIASSSGSTTYMNAGSGGKGSISTITLMEIAA